MKSLPNNWLGHTIRDLGARVLGRWKPIIRTGKLKLEIENLEDLFGMPRLPTSCEYEALLSLPIKFKRILDLGCNFGGFPLWLYEHGFVNELVEGWCVDANPKMFPKVFRNLYINNLRRLNCTPGLVGPRNRRWEELPFYVNTVNNSSSTVKFPYTLGKIEREIKVPVLDLDVLWASGVPPEIVNIDIEGGEFELFFDHGEIPACILEAHFLNVEWHEPVSDLDFLKEALSEEFDLVGLSGVSKLQGSALFKQKGLK